MADYSKREKELAKVAARLARDELVQEQADTLAFADRNREIVELPAGLENGLTPAGAAGYAPDRRWSPIAESPEGAGLP
jgi:hypothetical protein